MNHSYLVELVEPGESHSCPELVPGVSHNCLQLGLGVNHSCPQLELGVSRSCPLGEELEETHSYLVGVEGRYKCQWTRHHSCPEVELRPQCDHDLHLSLQQCYFPMQSDRLHLRNCQICPQQELILRRLVLLWL